MKALLYVPDHDGITDQLIKLIEVPIPREKLEVYHSMKDLSRRIKQPFNDLGVAVLVAANYEELKNIFLMRDLLRGLQIILVIPDQKEGTVALAHQLRPRLLSYINGDLSKITKVLAKMSGSR